MPRLSGTSQADRPSLLLEEVKAYPAQAGAVAFWQVGEGLGRKREIKARNEELNRTRQVVSAMRQLPPSFSRITTALVDGDLPLYSRAPGDLDTIGMQPLIWGSAQELRRAWSSSGSGGG